MRIIEPLRGDRLHHWFQVMLDDDPPAPGDYGVFRTSCGRDVNGRILTAEDEPSKRMCQRCERLA